MDSDEVAVPFGMSVCCLLAIGGTVFGLPSMLGEDHWMSGLGLWVQGWFVEMGMGVQAFLCVLLIMGVCQGCRFAHVVATGRAKHIICPWHPEFSQRMRQRRMMQRQAMAADSHHIDDGDAGFDAGLGVGHASRRAPDSGRRNRIQV